MTNFMKTAINESRKARGLEDMPAHFLAGSAVSAVVTGVVRQHVGASERFVVGEGALVDSGEAEGLLRRDRVVLTPRDGRRELHQPRRERGDRHDGEEYREARGEEESTAHGASSMLPRASRPA